MRLRISLACLLLATTINTGAAQEFMVTTKLYQQQPTETLVARSMSVFHAGRVYDYVDTVGELTVFEPAQKRFLIVNTGGMVATVLSFADIETYIYQTEARAKQIVAQKDGANLAAIAFQLKPDFETSYDKARKQLQLNHSLLSYNVECAEGSEEALATYCNYINWTAKLNYILHPQVLPNPRLALNAALESHRVLPLELKLDSNLGSGLHLKAVHKYYWRLDDGTRRQIVHWNSVLKDPNLKQVKFKEFQLPKRGTVEVSVSR